MINLGIIGCGPRGLAALECLFSEIANYEPIDLKIQVFDPADELGAGAVWNSNQSEANWINITLRGLSNLKGRESIKINKLTIPSFPKFTRWLEQDTGEVISNQKDSFLLRSKMGEYLKQRFDSISEVLVEHNILTIINKKIIDLHIVDGQITAIDSDEKAYYINECLITVGHQETEFDDQMKSWVDYTKSNSEISLFTSPYDAKIAESSLTNSNVAIRGLGLSTIDVIRELALQSSGSFSKSENAPFLVFNKTNACKYKIIPFSLDGLIAAPKPLTMVIDRQFQPSSSELTTFRESLIQELSDPSNISSINFLLTCFASSFVNKFQVKYNYSSDILEDLVTSWIIDPNTKHASILDTELELKEYLKALILMAIGSKKPSLDYCIGQYWKWLQPTMYEILSHANLGDKIMKKIISLDDQTKRYSYGPPVDSSLQLLALSESGILDLSLVNNPKIELSNKGWVLSNGKTQITCDIMINSVLPSPAAQRISDGPIKSLVDSADIDVVSSDLGVSTSFDGQIMFNSDKIKGVSILGRNAKGSVLGVDAILECFGPRIQDWAIGAVNRIRNLQS